ncbi:histone deacetylase 6 [Fistulifera solaris]|uniref:histone deacetylase n=1 Tax=Fistulifera solaris TaxID=1519565 RepID=A0A1Z5JP44_FISSO|nr:histone deacetylase 6 [Fistulifera solaris]|eukprot:GAX15787.1 histone deacetylase 6 [Fistulifera solaris]
MSTAAGSRKRSTSFVSQDNDVKSGKQLKTDELEKEKGPSNPFADTSLPTDPFVSLDDEVVRAFVDLEKDHPNRNVNIRTVLPLSDFEIKELERVLQFHVPPEQDEWRPDWSGNIAYLDKEVTNPKVPVKEKKSSFKQPFITWAQNIPGAATWVYNLLRYVYHKDGTPSSARAMIRSVDASNVQAMEEAVRRMSYDPDVLREDGWVTKRVLTPVGATGGAYHIAAKIRWMESDAVIIAYVHDAEIGDLWKALWIDEKTCFDLEYEEVLKAKRKWERKYISSLQTDNNRKSARYGGNADYIVPGIHYGIVLAASFGKGARPGVYWPARVMHVSEAVGTTQVGKRNSAKQKVDLIFLAPYWQADHSAARSRKPDGMSEAPVSAFASVPLFLLESVEATDEMIKEYTFGANGKLDMNELRMSFQFTGLPKQVFQRYVDGHRLAMALKLYAKNHLHAKMTPTDRASAGLFETHVMSIQAPHFPRVILELPFAYILDQLNRVNDGKRLMSEEEQPLQLHEIVKVMEPPGCWGFHSAEGTTQAVTYGAPPALSPFQSVDLKSDTSCLPPATLFAEGDKNSGPTNDLFQTMVTGLSILKSIFNDKQVAPSVTLLRTSVGELFALLSEMLKCNSPAENRKKQKSTIKYWIMVKRIGIETLTMYGGERHEVLAEWNLFIERVYKQILHTVAGESHCKRVSLVMSDYRCNGHRTSDGCFERAVRLPAALKGAKLAGAGTNPYHSIVPSVNDVYIDFVLKKVLPMAHAKSYLERMRMRCALARDSDRGLILTDDSSGDGGADTRGSKGTWDAAVAAVATVVSAVDKIIYAEASTAFCATRPPGHHAGKMLHPMKAVSNGFCILNAAACAALYAVAPVSEGGLGLSKVCVIDFDVHHGNGTQDILCSTYDPRFLYVSMHAGGAHVNGVTMEDDPDHQLHVLAGSAKQGIYPGRCGDTSPHEGVLNIPLGEKVLSHDIGLALISKVVPKVSTFLPDMVIISAGFDAHKCDPMGLGGLSAADFGHITDVICSLAAKFCSGRVVSILEGGYGVPCCREQRRNANGDSISISSSVCLGVGVTPTCTISSQNGVADVFQDDATTTSKDTAGVSETKLITDSDHREKDDGVTLNSSVPNQILSAANGGSTVPNSFLQPSRLLDLGDDLPSDMDDQVPLALQARLEKCYAEGFIDCVCEHVRALARSTK